MNVTFRAKSKVGNFIANIPGVKYAWWDTTDLSTLGAPLVQGENLFIDANGSITIPIPGTTLTAGQSGLLALYDSAGVNRYFGVTQVSNSIPIIYTGTRDNVQIHTYNSTGVVYTAPTQVIHDNFRTLIGKILIGEPYSDSEVSNLGFERLKWTDSTTGETFLLLREISASKSAKGACLFRTPGSQVKDVVIQVNHRVDDLHTGPISMNIFVQYPQFRAIQWNTVPRTVVDWTDHAINYPTAFAQAFVDVYSNGLLWQPHGYVQGSRTTTRGQVSEHIISAGVSPPTAYIDSLKTAMESRGFTNVYRYNSSETGATDYVTELGATLNRQGQAMRAENKGRFLHTEICRPVRDSLNVTESLRSNLAESILAIV